MVTAVPSPTRSDVSEAPLRKPDDLEPVVPAPEYRSVCDPTWTPDHSKFSQSAAFTPWEHSSSSPPVSDLSPEQARLLPVKSLLATPSTTVSSTSTSLAIESPSSPPLSTASCSVSGYPAPATLPTAEAAISTASSPGRPSTGPLHPGVAAGVAAGAAPVPVSAEYPQADAGNQPLLDPSGLAEHSNIAASTSDPRLPVPPSRSEWRYVAHQNRGLPAVKQEPWSHPGHPAMSRPSTVPPASPYLQPHFTVPSSFDAAAPGTAAYPSSPSMHSHGHHFSQPPYPHTAPAQSSHPHYLPPHVTVPSQSVPGGWPHAARPPSNPNNAVSHPAYQRRSPSPQHRAPASVSSSIPIDPRSHEGHAHRAWLSHDLIPNDDRISSPHSRLDALSKAALQSAQLPIREWIKTEDGPTYHRVSRASPPYSRPQSPMPYPYPPKRRYPGGREYDDDYPNEDIKLEYRERPRSYGSHHRPSFEYYSRDDEHEDGFNPDARQGSPRSLVGSDGPSSPRHSRYRHGQPHQEYVLIQPLPKLSPSGEYLNTLESPLSAAAVLSNLKRYEDPSMSSQSLDVPEMIPSKPGKRAASAAAATDSQGQPRIKRYRCQFPGCPSSFARAEHLQRHQLIHTGERPYRCDICGRYFSRRDNLQQHHQTHKHSKRKAGSGGTSAALALASATDDETAALDSTIATSPITVPVSVPATSDN